MTSLGNPGSARILQSSLWFTRVWCPCPLGETTCNVYRKCGDRLKSQTTLFIPQKNIKIPISRDYKERATLFIFTLIEWLSLLLSGIELVHRTCLQECFLTSIKWVTLRTCFDTYLISHDSTSCLECIATRAYDLHGCIFWMNIFFHKKWVRGMRSPSTKALRIQSGILTVFHIMCFLSLSRWNEWTYEDINSQSFTLRRFLQITRI